MFLNCLKIAYRNCRNHPLYSLINIFGLALGLALSLLILFYVLHESTYDLFQPHSDRVYRIVTTVQAQDRTLEVPSVPGAMARAMMESFPEVELASRIREVSKTVMQVGEKRFYETEILYVETSFFDLFRVEFLRGDPAHALEAPNSMVLTETMAKKYFGDEDPIGKTLTWNGRSRFAVTGVLREPPKNTHLRYSFLASFSTLLATRSDVETWMSFNYATYFRLAEGVDPASLPDKLNDLLDRNAGSFLNQFEMKVNLRIQPLRDIYLHPAQESDLTSGGNLTQIRLSALIAVFILLLACINFMNLSTARSSQRALEVGMRKVSGARRSSLMIQFFSETLLMSVAALAVAVLLAALLLPVFNMLVAKDFTLSQFVNWRLFLGALALVLCVGLLAGVYPALFLSSLRPAQVLRRRKSASGSASLLRNSLVIFQFAVSICLLCCTLIVLRQNKYLQKKDLGYQSEQTLTVQLRGVGEKAEAFKNEVLRLAGVIDASLTSAIPGEVNNETYFTFEGIEEPVVLPNQQVDEDFFQTLKMEIVQGRNFSPDFPQDRERAIVNESLVKRAGWDNALGKSVSMMDFKDDKPFYIPFEVIGVVKDFHFESLHQAIRPLVIRYRKDDVNQLVVRLETGALSQTMQDLAELWKSLETAYPFEYEFLDRLFDRLYRSEVRMGKLFAYFSGLAMFIACLGLFGLAAFSAEQRTKEIGIRKVLGASARQILLLLSGRWTRWVLVANAAAWPAAFFITRQWLNQFAYRVSPDVRTFILAGGLALAIAVATVTAQGMRAASANPVKSLRYE